MVVSVSDFEFFLTKLNSGAAGFNEVIAPHKIQSSGPAQPTFRFDKLKDDFLTVASHELRTPMSVINGFAEI